MLCVKREFIPYVCDGYGSCKVTVLPCVPFTTRSRSRTSLPVIYDLTIFFDKFCACV